MSKTPLKVRILRRDRAEGESYWEDFSVSVDESATVQEVLTAIQENPVNLEGKPVAPVVWECNCLEEVCGACAMLICGKPKMACGTLVCSVIRDRGETLTLAPLSKFPVVRDLIVDRSRIFETYKKYRIYSSPEARDNAGKKGRSWSETYQFTRCISCGCCAELCPNVREKSRFTGAVGMSILRVLLETGGCADLSGLTEKGGVAGCSGFSLCEKACPKGIDLPGAFAYANRAINKQLLGGKNV